VHFSSAALLPHRLEGTLWSSEKVLHDHLSPSKKYSGMGLRNMQERAISIAGELSIHSEAAHGTRVTISVKTPKENLD
jgi:signal transduction histidine kinase